MKQKPDLSFLRCFDARKGWNERKQLTTAKSADHGEIIFCVVSYTDSVCDGVLFSPSLLFVLASLLLFSIRTISFLQDQSAMDNAREAANKAGEAASEKVLRDYACARAITNANGGILQADKFLPCVPVTRLLQIYFKIQDRKMEYGIQCNSGNECVRRHQGRIRTRGRCRLKCC